MNESSLRCLKQQCPGFDAGSMRLPVRKSPTEFLSDSLLIRRSCNTSRYTPTNGDSSRFGKSFESPSFICVPRRFDSVAEIAVLAMLLLGVVECPPRQSSSLMGDKQIARH